jgi:DNA primase
MYLTSKGWRENEIEKAGLIKKTEKGYYDRFRNRIMFPISDTSGRIIAFSGRLFTDDLPAGRQVVSQPKYLNSPDTPIFSKSSVLFGLDKAKDSIRKNNFSILVEGQMDLVLSHQAGYKNTVATSGTALADSTIGRENVVSNLGLVRRLSPNIVLAFDGDKAGFNASLRAGRIALSLGMDVKVANMPGGVDPADLISKDGVDAWREAVRNSKHLIEFLLGRVMSDAGGDSRKAGREIKDRVLPFVDAVESSIEQMHFIKKISDTSGIPESALKDDLKKVNQESKIEKKEIEEIKNNERQVFRKDYIERRLLGIILWQKSLTKRVIDAEKILQDLCSILKIEGSVLLEQNADSKEDLIFEAEVFYAGDIDLTKDVNELLINLEEEYLKEELFKKMQELHTYEDKKDEAGGRQILKEINEINKKIQDIKNGRLKKPQ